MKRDRDKQVRWMRNMIKETSPWERGIGAAIQKGTSYQVFDVEAPGNEVE